MKTSIGKLQKASDALLVRLYQRGSNSAFDALVLRHSSRLKQYLHVLLHNFADEQDVLQEVWIAVSTRIKNHRYAEQGRFATWLTTLAFRMARSFYRKQHPIVSDALVAEAASAIPLEEPPAVVDERMEALKQSLTKLNARMRAFVYEHVYEEKTFADIAQQHHTSTGTVSKEYSRAVKKLRAWLRKKK